MSAVVVVVVICREEGQGFDHFPALCNDPYGIAAMNTPLILSFISV
jgi:hypothetical protein